MTGSLTDVPGLSVGHWTDADAAVPAVHDLDRGGDAVPGQAAS
jgi:L-aminopeptidase/D-esterase-like protein